MESKKIRGIVSWLILILGSLISGTIGSFGFKNHVILTFTAIILTICLTIIVMILVDNHIINMLDARYQRALREGMRMLPYMVRKLPYIDKKVDGPNTVWIWQQLEQDVHDMIEEHDKPIGKRG